ncbi:MAG: hypothetical protein ACKVTZ_15640 [Bacteroidia bacterium]
MIYFRFIAIIIFCFFSACQSSDKKAEKQTQQTVTYLSEMQGDWVLMEYVQALKNHQTPEKAAKVLNGWVELVIEEDAALKDSVRVFASYNNHEGQTFFMPKKGEKGKLFLLVEGRTEQDTIFLTYHPQKQEIALWDKKEMQQARIFQRVEIPLPERKETAERGLETTKIEVGDGIRSLASQLIVGEYVHFSSPEKTIAFTPTGEITGLSGYEHYELLTDFNDALDSCDYLMLFTNKYQVAKKIYAIDLENPPFSLFETVEDRKSGILKKGKKIGELKKRE